jgi:hypothetical protein
VIDPVDRKYNLKNLEYIVDYLSHLDYFLFFGTLLGYYREGNILPEDDDVDIYVDIKHRDELIGILQQSEFSIRINNPYFLQGHRILEGINTYFDFYLYETDDTKDYISERWNIAGDTRNADRFLHTPKDMVFPIGWGSIGDIKVKIPHDVSECCRFLYGDKYKTPLKKDVEYRSEVVNNKPITYILKGELK